MLESTAQNLTVWNTAVDDSQPFHRTAPFSRLRLPTRSAHIKRWPQRTNMSPVEELVARISALPGAARTRSRFGSKDKPAWSVQGHEFAHLHADDLLDLRLPRQVQASLKNDPRAHFRKSRSEW